MGWATEASADTRAAPDRVWALWADVDRWVQWDSEIEFSSIDGPFEAGTTGELKTKGGPKSRFTITEATPGRSFTNSSRLPLAALDFSHMVTPTSTGSTIVHRVAVTGPLAFVFRRLLGPRLERGLPAAVEALARAAEQSAD